MTVEIRPALPEEMVQMGAIGSYSYAGAFGDGPDTVMVSSNRPEWTLCAFIDGEMAASFCTIPFTMRALGRAVPMGGISMIGTLPHHRRKGLVRKLMTQALGNMRDSGQMVAALWASQAAIYQRYQFAMATVCRSYDIDTVDIGFHDSDMGDCEVVLTGPENCLDELKSIYIENATDRICYLHRSSLLWRMNFLDDRPEDGPVRIGLCRDDTGSAVGYVVFSLRAAKVNHPSRGQQIKIRDLVALNSNAYRSLWRFIASHDLVGSVQWHNAPLDDPASELFIEPRLLKMRDDEGLWFRVVDVAGALGQRGYIESGEIRIGIQDDPLAPWNGGTYLLRASPDGAEVSRSSGSPDIQLSVKALGSLYTGFRSAAVLAGWGLVEGDRQKIALAGRIFSSPYLPHCPDHF
jgi:predicted acetyltransferase